MGKSNLIAVIIILLLAAYFIPWRNVNWGKVAMLPGSTITVTGEARSEQANQTASFTAGVTEVSDDKDQAVEAVNTTVAELIQAVKDFGIDDADIKTQNLSVYQMEEPITLDGRQRTEPGAWRVSNDISIRLRDINQASELATLLTNSGATNVFGPNFTVDETTDAELGLMDQAIQNARAKAQSIAQASGKQVGEVINVIEGGASSPVYPMLRDAMGAGGGAPVEPGTSTISKSLTVTFELK
jgi:uncharacterized protein